MRKKLTALFSFHFIILVISSLQILAGDKIESPNEAVYVFYRGYHFLNGEVISKEKLSERGIFSRSLSNGDIQPPEIGDAISKIQTLNRPWTKEEQIEFKSACDTPYQELVQLYTNHYATFIDELDVVNSNTRRILKLAGLENITANFLISTSLKAWQAYKYGAGLKLYKDVESQRYPSYSKPSFTPKNPIIGFVDVIIVPAKEIRNLGGFFVLDSFATGSIKLAYHFSNNLTEEREVVFPFYINAKYHVKRMPITLPSLHHSINGDGLQRAHWRKEISSATANEQKEVELKLIVSVIAKASEALDKNTTLSLEQYKKVRVYNGPSLVGLEKALVPAEAIVMRNDIVHFEQMITAQFFDKATHVFAIPIKNLSFPLCHALKRLAKSAYPITIFANFGMNSIKFDLMNIFLNEDGIVKVKFKSNPDNLQNLCEQFYALDVTKNYVWDDADAIWFDPDKSIIPNLLGVSNARTEPLVIDVSGLGLAPKYFEANMAMVNMVDEKREIVEKAYEWVVDGVDFHADYVREALYG